jgi:hypothetical protein
MFYNLNNLHQSYTVISFYHSCVTGTIFAGVTPCSLVEESVVSQRPVSDVLRINGGGRFIGNLGV